MTKARLSSLQVDKNNFEKSKTMKNLARRKKITFLEDFKSNRNVEPELNQNKNLAVTLCISNSEVCD